MLRFSAAMLAVSTLAACATVGGGEHAQVNTSGAPEGARPVDRQARRAVAREDILTQMAYWAGEYQTFPNDLEAAQQFSEALRKGDALIALSRWRAKQLGGSRKIANC